MISRVATAATANPAEVFGGLLGWVLNPGESSGEIGAPRRRQS
ncbi:hypothetical protein [Dietzia sp. DQ11-44]|nr:hypothetical protein [Dietzia sp. DQ11-44]